MNTYPSSFLRHAILFASVFALAGCGGGVSSSSAAASSAKSSSSNPFVNPFASSSTSGTAASSTSSVSSSLKELEAYTLAEIKGTGEYVCEAEACDLSHCTLQAGCARFIEDPDASLLPATSGGECVACISGPSVMAFKIECYDVCDISFKVVCAKYESSFDLDANVSFYLDSNDPFKSGFTTFGHTDANQWYNWKTVTLGSLSNVAKGTHVFNISVKANGAFPNTDCFKLEVTKYAGVAAVSSDSPTSSVAA